MADFIPSRIALLGATCVALTLGLACGGGGSGDDDPETGESSNVCEPGEIGCECLDGTCAEGLVCEEDLCVEGDVEVDVMLDGGVQKGPFVLGTSVSVSLLDAVGNPTGDVFNTMTDNDLGEFSVACTGDDEPHRGMLNARTRNTAI